MTHMHIQPPLASSNRRSITSLAIAAFILLLSFSLVVALAKSSKVSSQLLTIPIVLPLLCLLALLHKKILTSCKGVPRLPPTPAGQLFIIGNAHQMVSNKPAFRWMHHQMEELNTDIACFRIGNVHLITVTCPKIAQEFLRKQDANFASRPLTFAAEAISKYKTTAMSPLDDQWKKMRKVLTREILSPAMERCFCKKRTEEANHLVKYIYNQWKQSKSVNIRVVARHYAGNSIRRLVFDKRYFGEPTFDGGPGPDEVEHVDALFTCLEQLYAISASEYFPTLLSLKLDRHAQLVKDAVETLRRLHDPIINDRIEQARLLCKGDERREVGDFLDVFISLQDKDKRPLLTVEEIKAQIIEIMMASVDNTSNAIEWALAEMVNNPEILHKAIEEVDRVIGKHKFVQESNICELNYLKACIRETFRLHPFLPFNVPHAAMADTMVAGYFIPKGSNVLLSRMGLGRNPKIWDEPLKFRPERHLNGGIMDSKVALTEPNLHFISFSSGRRGCPAVSLGTSMTIILFARLLQGFTWSKPPGVAKIELKESVSTLYLAEPLVLCAEPRLPLHLYSLK